MPYILEHLEEAARLERQARAAQYDVLVELEGFGLSAGMRVLDAGCGSGLAARAVAKEVPGIQVFGIDVSEARIAEARKLASKELGVEFQVGDLNQPLERTFDRIFCRFVVEHLDDEKQAGVVQALANSLVPGGKLRLVDIDGGMLNIFPRTALLDECLSLFEVRRAIDFYVGRKLPKLLVDAGFEDVTWSIQPMVMNEPRSLDEEIALVSERFHHTHAAMTRLLGSPEKATRFQREYIATLRRPGTTLFYNKFVATGTRARVSPHRNLAVVP